MNNIGPKTAMILAAGLGKRMRPITNKTPKPLLNVGERSLINYELDRLLDAGVKRVVINTHHLANQIKDHLQDRNDLELVISDESKRILETGGGVTKALPHLGDGPFYLLNGDILWLDGPTAALDRLAANWNKNEMDGLLLLHSTVEAYGYSGLGDFVIDPIGKLVRRPEALVSPYLFTGVQILHPELFEKAPAGAFSLNLLYDRSIDAGRLFGIVHDGDWFHIGSSDGLNQAEKYFRQRFPGSRRR